MNKKQISHDKYNSLSQEQKDKLRERAINKLPVLLKKSESAIYQKMCYGIRLKLNK